MELAKAEAKDNLDLALKASALSEAKSQKLIDLALKASALSKAKTEKMIAKSQRLITSTQKQSEKKIALITHRANKKIEAALETDSSIIEMTRAHAHELSSLTSKHKLALSDSQAQLKSLASQHKFALRDTQTRHLLRFEKQKQSMTNEMIRLRELLYGQNEMIDGCLDEMKDERRAARLASDWAKQLKVIASNRMDKIKWWKAKCNKLTLLQDAYVSQANKMEEMQQKIDEYERLSEDMTEDYEETILSMCPRYIEKARVRNLTNKYGHQEWKSFVDKLIIEFLCDRVPPTCIQLVMVAMSKGESIARQ